MKNKKTKRTLLALLLLASCLCCTIAGVTMSACKPKETLLYPINLTYDKDTWILSWEEVENATSYTVEYGTKQKVTTTETSIDLTYILSPNSDYDINVYANGNKKLYKSSYEKQKFYVNTEESLDQLSYTLLEDGSGYSIKFSKSILSTALPTRLVLPDTYNGKPIKEIADCCFAPARQAENGNIVPKGRLVSEVKYIRFPKAVQVIQPYAFYNFTKLTSLNFPSSLKRIEDQAFLIILPDPTKHSYTLGNLEVVEFNKGLEYIGTSTFYNNYIRKAIITAKVVGDNTFGFGKLKEVILTDDVEEINGGCFADCTELTVVDFGKNVKMIGEYAFNKTPWESALPDGMIVFNKTLYKYNQMETELYSITVPSTIKYIAGGAFGDCNRLQSISIPDGVVMSSTGIFADCSQLNSVRLPKGLTALPNRTFYYCKSLKQLTNLPDTISSFGAYCFAGSGIEEMKLPKSLKRVGDGCFTNCSSLTTIDVSQLEVMPTFRLNKALQTVVLPKTVTQENLANTDYFENCISLKSVTLPEGLTKLSKTFSGCTLLEEAIIPSTVTDMGSVFTNCTSLTQVVIPTSVTKMTYCFSGCLGLKNIFYQGTLAQWDKIDMSSSDKTFFVNNDVTISYYSATQPTASGNYWHYLNGVATKW